VITLNADRQRTSKRGGILRKTCTALLALLCIGGLACGSKSEEDDVKSTAKNFTSAFLDKDYGKACSLMTSETRSRLASAAKSIGKKGCEGTLESAARLLNARSRKRLESYKVESVKIKGDSATAKDNNGQSQRLRKEDGNWRIDTSSTRSGG
jgi:hypothetical protein